ncbi:MAG: PIN domain-containing protein [Gammaproteobacteria bacterium]|nr:PIN domain-containing protein [Gammaproteobacteria bacterium]MCP5458279.1 PIN domain-containing protein [Gammaproteobacteria bacterium]
MSANEPFFDTNVLLYLLSGDAVKADKAERLIAAGGVISVQVLDEFATVASCQLDMSWGEIREVLKTLRAVCRIVPVSLGVHERGLLLCERYGFAVYDAMILSAALLAGCTVLLTEDLQDGQRIDDQLLVSNPFL